jgi:hypothetical protein
MKKIFLIALIIIAGLSINATINFGDCEKDEGNIVKQEISISSFKKLKLNGSATVFITTEKSQKVIIETTQNIIDLLKTDVKEGEWTIGFEKCLNLDKQVKFYIDVESIDKLSINGSGDIIGKNKFISKNLDLNVKGSGDIKIDVETNNINAKVYGSGDIKINGTATSQNIVIKGSGDYTATNLTSKEAVAIVYGSGDIDLNVSKKLKAQVHGSGDISYSGNPVNVDNKVNGSGDITAK